MRGRSRDAGAYAQALDGVDFFEGPLIGADCRVSSFRRRDRDFCAMDGAIVGPGQAKVAELVDALDLGSSGATRESSSLSFRTTPGFTVTQGGPTTSGEILPPLAFLIFFFQPQ